MLLKRTSAFLLILAFLAQAFSRYLIVADYYVNTEAYLQNCVNKDKPWMHCGGRCQLCKKLGHEDGSDKQSPERKSGEDRNDPLSFPSSLEDFSLPQLAALTGGRYPGSAEGKPVRMPRSLFHPPGDRLV
jgi:hypothetical protein